MAEQPIFLAGNLAIYAKRVADQAAVDLLKRTRYGAHGIRYQHTGQEEKISQLRNPTFFHLLEGDELIGIYCLDERQIDSSVSRVKAFYGRYLAIDDTQKGRGHGRLLKREAVRYVERTCDQPYVLYSYIEEKNTRSLSISQQEGFQSAAILKTYVFRRYSPEIDSRFERLAPSETTGLLSLLESYYKAHTFKTFANIGYQTNYFALKEAGEVIAGIQANPVCWRFQQMPGLSGWVMMNLLPMLSATRRFFNPAQYAFVVLEGLYLKKGREDILSVLLESVLAHFQLHSALWQIDEKDPIISLLSGKDMGFLSGFQKGIRTHVMVKSVGLSTEELSLEKPFYASCFDFA